MLRRNLFSLTNAVKATTRVSRSNVKLFSTLINKKEVGEETIYFRRLEQERADKETQRKNQLAEILSRSDSDESKRAILDVVEPKKPEGLLQMFGLHDWRIALPVGITVGGPMVQYEFIIVDHKFYILAAFTMFWHAFALVFVPIYKEMLGGDAERVHNIYKAAEEASMSELTSTIKESEKLLAIEDVVKDVYTLRDDLSVAQAEALNLSEQHNLRKSIVQKLDALVALEESAAVAIRNDMITTIKSDVSKAFQKDQKVKEQALAQAIAALSGAKRNKDVVGDVFKSSIQSYRKNAGDAKSSSSLIIAKLEKEIDEIAKAPAIQDKAGNVYETHKIAGLGSF